MKKTPKLFIVFLIGLCLLPVVGCACSCGPYVKSFCQAVNMHKHVVLAEISANISFDKKKIRVIDDIRLELDTTEVTLIGQDGVNCGADLNPFSIGDTLILALYGLEDSTYILDGCGRNYLHYTADEVKGPIKTETDTTMSYADFVAGIEDCILLVPAEDRKKDQPAASLSPNPCHDLLTVQLHGTTISRVDLYGIDGRLLRSQKNQDLNKMELDVQGLQPGVYIARIYYPGGSVSRKVSKVK